MKLDAFGGGPTLADATQQATAAERAGFDGLWIPEGAAPAFELCTAAALSAPGLELGTGVAVAFARSPMVTAQAAWLLARATDGRFRLGLGSQVRAHVERRYAAQFDPPGPRLREYVAALRAIFDAFARRAPLDFRGEFYTLTLLPEQFWTPPPLAVPDPPILLAGVRPWMCRMIGEVADGMKVHPLHTSAYLRDVVLPNLRSGAQRAGRTAPRLVIPVMTAAADDEPTLLARREHLRRRVAFYGATPGYDVVFAATGFTGLGAELRELMRAGRTDAMAALVTDDLLAAVAVTAGWSDLPAMLAERYSGLADRVVCYATADTLSDPAEAERWQDVTREFRRLTATTGAIDG